MSEIKAIEKLREFVDDQFVISGQSYLQGMAIANSIEAEIAERYMKLPVYADGVPIHVGDRLGCKEQGGKYSDFEVTSISETLVFFDYGASFIAAVACHHVKPRTVEDVLMDVMSDFADADFNDETLETITARYADEIREIIGGGE